MSILTSHPILPTIVALTQSRVATMIVAKLVNNTAMAVIVGPVFSEGFDISSVVEDMLNLLATLGSVHAVIHEVAVGAIGVMLRFKGRVGGFRRIAPMIFPARTKLCTLELVIRPL